MSKVPYTLSVRKQIEWFIAMLFLICLFGWVLYPVNNPVKTAIFVAFTVTFGAIVILKMRKLATAAACPDCGVDLYEIIQTARLRKIPFRHCPACGKSVEV